MNGQQQPAQEQDAVQASLDLTQFDGDEFYLGVLAGGIDPLSPTGAGQLFALTQAASRPAKILGQPKSGEKATA